MQCDQPNCCHVSQNYYYYRQHLKLIHAIKPPEHRKRYKIHLKLKVLQELKSEEVNWGLRDKINGQYKSALHKKKRPGIQKQIADDYGIDTSLITKWRKSEWDLLQAKNKKHTQLVQGSCVEFLQEETELYEIFLFRREVLGLAVDGLWLRFEFMKIHERDQPAGWETFKYSNGWVSGFCRRWEISSQAQTNKKHVPLITKIPLVKEFHAEMLKLQLSMTCSLDLACGCCDRKYGRFGPLSMFHADQIPMEFACKNLRTLNAKGTACWLFSPGSGLEKRQATIMLCLRAGGPQVVKMCIIFKGGGHLTQEELVELKKIKEELGNIRFYFQENAWADGKFMVWWLKKFVKDCKQAGLISVGSGIGLKEQVLLGLDRHAAQKTLDFLRVCHEGGVLPFYTPPDCTDCISPCDHHVGKWLKGEIGGQYKLEVESKRQQWAEDNVGPQEKRVLMLRWLGNAWNLLRENSAFILSTFTSTGFLMELENPNKNIKMEKIQGYDIFQ